MKLLQTIVIEYSRCFIILDALDECSISDGRLGQLLSGIFHIQAKTGMNLFATSRNIPKIQSKFKNCKSIEIRASEDDLQKYLLGQMPRLPGFVSKKPDLQEEIKTKITRAADGMYACYHVIVPID